MPSSLAALAARLQAEVPPRDGVPADYAQLIQDAVAQFSTDIPIQRTATLTIVAGTSAYMLPDDFLFVIDFPLLRASADLDVVVTDNGLVPLPGDYEERYDIVGDQLILDPVPAFGGDRTLRYAAAHVLDGDGDTYPYLSNNGARLVLMYGRYLALSLQAAAVADGGWRYQIGDEMVDKSNQSRGLREQAERWLSDYRAAVRQFQRY